MCLTLSIMCSLPTDTSHQPSLMTFREVETLAHEFGHALQHMLTTQDEGMVAGINGVEWDAVEVASQVCRLPRIHMLWFAGVICWCDLLVFAGVPC